MFDIKVHHQLEKFALETRKKIEKAAQKACKATANSIIKITLPNNYSTSKNSKNAKSTVNKGVKALKERIKNDIMGDGVVGSGIRSGIRLNDGMPKPHSVKGKSSAPFMILLNKERSRKSSLPPPTNSSDELYEHIKKHSYLRKKKNVAKRFFDHNAPLMWVKSKSVVTKAVSKFVARAGNLLSGWKKLAETTNINALDGLLKNSELDSNGDAEINNKDGIVKLEASNETVNKAVADYQQNVVDGRIEKEFEYHLTNEISHINFNK